MPSKHVEGIPWCPSVKIVPSLLTSQAFFSIWAPFALCQDLAISCTNLFQGKASLKDCSAWHQVARSACQLAGSSLPSLPFSISSNQNRWQKPGNMEGPHHKQTQSLPERPRCFLQPVQWVGRDRALLAPGSHWDSPNETCWIEEHKHWFLVLEAGG